MLKHKDEVITLMPEMAKVARELAYLSFPDSEEVEAAQALVLKKKATVHEYDPELIVWGRRCHQDDDGVSYYESVRIDGVRYKVRSGYYYR